MASVVCDNLQNKNTILFVKQGVMHIGMNKGHHLLKRTKDLSAQTIFFNMKGRFSQGLNKFDYGFFKILVQGIHGYINGYVHFS
mgnify:CR=1 FL=1